MPKNRLYTQSYFIKRLIENEFNIQKLNVYASDDIRKWTIVVDPGVKEGRNNIIVTCYRNSPEDFWFVLDSKRKRNIIVKTKSINTVVDILHNLMEDINYSDINNGLPV